MNPYRNTFKIYIPVALLISGLLIGCGGKDEVPLPEVWTEALVHEALKARNPDYTCKASFRIDDGKVTGMELSGAGVTDLSSLEGMRIRGLDLRGSGIDDISPLKVLPLEQLYLEDTEVVDLEPLRGMKLKKLYLNNTEVSDLDPLEGMPLIMLNLLGTEVEDLEPLRGMPLQYLWLNETPVSDIEPLSGCPLVSLTLHRTGVKNIGPIAKITTLQRLHIGETPVTDLTPLEGMKLQRLIFTPSKIAKGVEGLKKMHSLTELGTTFENRMDSGELLALRVIPLSGQTLMEEVRDIAGKAWERLEGLVGELDDLDLPVRPLVRIAPSVSQGFMATADEYKADYLIMGWPENDRERDAGQTSTVERVFESTSRPLAIFRGTIEGPARSVLVAGQGGSNTVAAAELAAVLASAGGGKAVYLTIHRRRTGDGDPDPLPIGEGLDLERRVVQADNVKTGILNEARSSDLLLMGAPIDHLLDRSYLGGMPVEVARSRERPTIVVKASEHRRAFWLRRVWEFVSRLLPDLSIRERAEVYRQMRNDARADIDFFTLIVLSSAIAILGLILNSGAVIIGAMLVAPLMSPMMAIAHGIVQGNMIMIRRGLISTFKGVAISIGVGTVMTMIVNPYQPTVEILARSGPTLLDLMVALASGAAGAYAVSRRSVAAALPGVAISVALVPPLCVVGYGIGSGNFRIAGGAFILFMTNLAAIVLISAFVFLLVGFRPTRSHRGRQVMQAVLVSLLSVFILIVPLWLETGTVTRIERIEARIDTIFREELAGEAILLSLEIKREGGVYVIDAVALSFQEEARSAEGLEELRLFLSRDIGAPVRINLTAAPARHFQAAGEGPVEESRSVMLPVGEEETAQTPKVSEDGPAQTGEQTEK